MPAGRAELVFVPVAAQAGVTLCIARDTPQWLAGQAVLQWLSGWWMLRR